MEDILAIVMIFGGGTAYLLAISPIGKALASRIHAPERAGGEQVGELVDSQEALLHEVEGLRQEVVEIQERLDFTERLLAQARHDELPPVSGGG